MKKRLILFFHPADERKPEKDQTIYKWAKDVRHSRKYVVSNGKLLSSIDDEIKECNFGFWTEWEAISRFEEINNASENKKGFPERRHYPIKPLSEGCNSISSEGNGSCKTGYLNTDPCVLGNMFLYSNCQQDNNVKKCKILKDLEPGGIILFGSGKQSNEKNIYDKFICDTIFVTKYKIENLSSETFEDFYNDTIQKLKEQKAPDRTLERFTRLSKWYYTLTIESLKNKNKYYTLYIGATIDDRIDNIYSYVPCKEIEDLNSDIGFERPDLSRVLKNYFTNVKNNNGGFGNQTINYKNDVDDIEDIEEVWNKIKECIINHYKLDIGTLCDFYE
ncbi:hypothetical protein [Clostridium hydrogeniformans]|uniref:hypothetical protein n=1 Tax=Clostridium hydrogeniformans TaxID=349933 RepID=UPI0004842F83|nr:hypothetical protein [Clostridium hydrogeniformans]